MESISFADYFGMDIPTEKNKTNKTATKKGTKSTKSKSKKKDEKKYSLPITIHSEIGDVVVEGLEDLTLKQITNKLGFGKNVEVIENSGDFICIFTPINMNDNDEITGTVKFGREEYEEEAMTVKELKKILLENHPELSSTSNFNIAKLDNELYIVRLKNPVEMSLQLTENAKIGFMGNYSKVGKAMILKEAASKWENEESWLSKVDKNYYFDGNTETVIVSFVKTKNASTELLVKVPCNIRFIHDAGPLSEGLTYEMFGKEYINIEDILNLVSNYFDGYKKDNTTVSYIPQINTVCVMLSGRKKGICDIYTGEIINGAYVHTAPKIPFIFLEKIRMYFIEECPNEALVQIIYNKETETYRLYFPDAEADVASLKWSDMDILRTIGISEIVVCEIHSHNFMSAYFSFVDNNDEILPMIYGVMGKLENEKCEVKFRVRSGKDFYNVFVSELFE